MESRADVVFAALLLEREIIRRAVLKNVGWQTDSERLGGGSGIDEINLRPRKRSGRRSSVAQANRGSLDRSYLVPKLKEIAEGLDRPDILTVLESES
jgi:hypothetical protein